MGKSNPEGYEARVIAELRDLIERNRKVREELRELLASPHAHREPLRRRIRAESWPLERRQIQRRRIDRKGSERRRHRQEERS